MTTQQKPRTAEMNGKFWGSSADDWAEIQEGTCRPVYLAVLDELGVKDGTSFLDAGCGAGMAAQLAFERGASVSGADAASNLIEIARRRVPEGQFSVCDLEELLFKSSSFDIVTGFNSFQYAGNPIAALLEAKRVAKSGATVVVMTWGQPEGMEAASLVTALGPLLPKPPPGAPGPFALSDESSLRKFAESAGLKPISLKDIKSPWLYPDRETALKGLRSSGVAARAIENASLEAVDEANSAALEPFQTDDGSYRIDATFRCLYTEA